MEDKFKDIKLHREYLKTLDEITDLLCMLYTLDDKLWEFFEKKLMN